jgi:hypothetical protein
MVQKAQSNDIAAQRQFLPDPSKMNLLPDGEAIVINRPLAIPYEIPGRGNTPHQIDNNVKTDDFSPSPNDGPIDTMPDPDTVHGKDIYAELIPPKPVPVVIVPKPYRTTLKNSRMITVWATGTDIPAAPYAPYVNMDYAKQLVGYDPTRTRLVIQIPQTAPFYCAISDDPNFSSYLIGYTSDIVILGQNAIYVAPYLAGTAEPNPVTDPWMALVETETSLDSNP